MKCNVYKHMYADILKYISMQREQEKTIISLAQIYRNYIGKKP